MQALQILAGALFAVLAATALGAGLLGDRDRDFGLRFVTGAALLSLAIFGLCAAGLAYAWVFAAAGAAAVVVYRRELAETELAATRIHRVLAPAFAVYILLYFFNSMAPEISYDGSRYHLGLVSRYVREHGFQRITDNLYASLSQGIEMLYVYAFAFGRHSAAAMLHFAFLLALVALMLRYATRAGFPLAGAVGALLVFASPIVGVDGTSAYNDVATAAIAFALFYLLQRWNEERSTRLLVTVGLVAGFAYAAKYTAWLAVPYCLGFVAWKSRSPRNLLLVAVCAALPIAPWMAKNWIWVHNPVAPFFNGVFPNPYLTVAFEREYRHHLAWYGIQSRWELPMLATVRGSLSGLLGPVFVLSPLALLSLRSKEGRQLLLAALVFGGNYFSNIGTRFLIPPLPFVALAMALALNQVPRAALALALVHAVISWPSIVRLYAAPDAWHLVKVPYREALRIKPEEGFLESNLPDYAVDRLLERTTEAGSTIFSLTPIPEAYTSRKIRVAYQSAAGVEARAILYTGFAPDFAPTWRLRFRFPRRALRSIRLVQTNTNLEDSWSLHEIRFFDGTQEVPRVPGWRWNARPSPWGIERAGDGRLITFWTCGDTLRAGQQVQIDFDGAREADSVLLETSPNQWGLRLELHGRGETGDWQILAPSPEIDTVPTPPGLRRAAAEELKRKGIDYLVLFDGEFGADDLRVNASQWGAVSAGEYRAAKLYRLPARVSP